MSNQAAKVRALIRPSYRCIFSKSMNNETIGPSFFDSAQERDVTDARALPEGYRINEFEIQTVLGSGSFAIVYRAYDHSLAKVRAIKEYLPRGLAARFDNNVITILSKKDEAAYKSGLASFLEEARLLAGINHSSVVRVYRCIEANGTAYMVMDLCEGETLEQRIASSPQFEETWVRTFLASLLGGVQALHRANILHRDIKPSNIFLSERDRPVLIDFGSARQLSETGEQRALTAVVTYNYSAPEQWDSTGQFAQGPYSDLYSIGATCYEILAQRKPNASNTRLLRDLLVPAADICKGRYSHKLLQSVDKALKISVHSRYPTAQAWLDDLDADFSRVDVQRSRPSTITFAVTIGIATMFAVAWLKFRPMLEVDVSTKEVPKIGAGSLYRDCPTCPEMILIEKGSFQQGATGNSSNVDELPRHNVTISTSFAVSRFEISKAQFKAFVNASGYNFGGDASCEKKLPDGNERNWLNPGFAQQDDHPVVCVNWFDANAYVQWLSQATGKSYRLLTESEWEYLARAGNEVGTSWGLDEAKSCEYENLADESFAQSTGAKFAFKCNDQTPFTAPGSTTLRQNRFGVHDTLGNVAEWVSDCKTPDYNGAPIDGSAANSATCQSRVFRGGAFNYSPSDVRFSARSALPPGQRRPYLGMRIASDWVADGVKLESKR